MVMSDKVPGYQATVEAGPHVSSEVFEENIRSSGSRLPRKRKL